MWIQWLIIALYFSALAGLGLWGLHRLLLLYWLRSEPPAAASSVAFKPSVLVQLPIFNEPAVVTRVIDAAAQLDWPNLTIQVLDDSTDETTPKAKARVDYWASRGINISHVRRTKRFGFKAGALAHGLDLDHSPFVAIFDADFIPERNFLTQLMPDLCDPSIGMVQARWGHINRDQNFLTRLEALILDGHFVIEHTARYRRECFFNFNGTAGIWRRDCIADAGGWAHDTVTEDLDLSYRAQLRGWRFIYRDDIIAPGEVPGTVRAFLTQQHRWAKGTAQTARKLAPAILQADLPLIVRLEALNHLFMVTAYPAMLLLAVCFPLSISARDVVFDVDLRLLDLATVLATTGSIICFYATAMKRGGEAISERWWEIPMAMALGVGASVNQTLAVVEGVFTDDATFVRTPKQGVLGSANVVPRVLPMQLLLTMGMSAYYLDAIHTAVLSHNWMSLPLLLLFGLGFMLISFHQLMEGNRTVEAAEMGVAPATK